MARKGLGRGLGVIFGSETEGAARRGVSPHAVSHETSGDAASSETTHEATSRETAPATHEATSSETAADTTSRGTTSAVSRETSQREIDITLIDPCPSQPRKSFDEQGLRELADSILQHGLLQPILVKARGGRYEIIVGERRYRAARLAGLAAIPAIVRTMDRREASEAALIENIQREDLGPLEEARAYQALIDGYGLTQEELAAKVSKSRAAVANSLRLLRLDPEILSLIEEGSLTAGHARALLSISGSARRLKAAREIVSKGMSVREAERLSKRLATRSPAPASAPDDELTRYLDAAALDLMSALGSKVRIRRTGSEKGKIEIEYHSHDELGAIIDKLSSIDTRQEGRI